MTNPIYLKLITEPDSPDGYITGLEIETGGGRKSQWFGHPAIPSL